MDDDFRNNFSCLHFKDKIQFFANLKKVGQVAFDLALGPHDENRIHTFWGLEDFKTIVSVENGKLICLRPLYFLYT